MKCPFVSEPHNFLCLRKMPKQKQCVHCEIGTEAEESLYKWDRVFSMWIRPEVAELVEHTTYITLQTKDRTTIEEINSSFVLKIRKQSMKELMKQGVKRMELPYVAVTWLLKGGRKYVKTVIFFGSIQGRRGESLSTWWLSNSKERFWTMK